MPHSDVITQLPHRRNEAWKWTDVRGSVKDEQAGLTSVMTPQIEAPDGVKVTVGAGQSGDAPMSQLAQSFAAEGLTYMCPRANLLRNLWCSRS